MARACVGFEVQKCLCFVAAHSYLQQNHPYLQYFGQVHLL